MIQNFSHFAVLGAGAWGTALALTLSRAGHKATLWGRDQKQMQHMRQERRNPKTLSDVALPDKIMPTSNITDCSSVDALLWVLPAQQTRQLAPELLKEIAPTIPLILCSKGIEKETGILLPDMMAQILPNPILTLSGPNFAGEIAAGLPAATTIACKDEALAQSLCHAISSKYFRCYASGDVTSVQIAGAVKNVLAIACGITHGKKLGANAAAALITRGLHEIAKLATAMGGKQETLLGLSGVGDITLSCSTLQSRNMSLGAAVGEGRSLKDILAGQNYVTEGVATALAVCQLAEKHQIDMPICQAVKAILHDHIKVEDAIDTLLARPVG